MRVSRRGFAALALALHYAGSSLMAPAGSAATGAPPPAFYLSGSVGGGAWRDRHVADFGGTPLSPRLQGVLAGTAGVGRSFGRHLALEVVYQGAAGVVSEPAGSPGTLAPTRHRASTVAVDLARTRLSPWDLDGPLRPFIILGGGIARLQDEDVTGSGANRTLASHVRHSRATTSAGLGLALGNVGAFRVEFESQYFAMLDGGDRDNRLFTSQFGVAIPLRSGAGARDRQLPRSQSGDLPPGPRTFLAHTSALATGMVCLKLTLDLSASRKMMIDDYRHFRDNVAHTPRFDDGNPWFTNWLVHPLNGSQGYLIYRNAGYSPRMAALGVVVLSTIHEYLVETSFEPPSGVDLVVTPGVGIPLGMALERASTRLARSRHAWARVLGVTMNPLRALGALRSAGQP